MIYAIRHVMHKWTRGIAVLVYYKLSLENDPLLPGPQAGRGSFIHPKVWIGHIGFFLIKIHIFLLTKL